MQTIFAIDGSDFGAASQDVATLQNALVALGKGIGDTSLSKLTIDGLIGPKTTAATNRAFTVHLGSGQAPASYRTGAMSQAQVETSANTLAAYIETELVRRGFSAPPVKIVAPAKKATTSTTKTAAAVPTATYLPTAALKPAVYLPPDASDGPSQGTQIVKWSAIGLGAVIVASLAYYLIKKRAPSAFRGFGEITLHERIAQALNWPLRDVESMSLPSLHELVRPVDRRLAEEISESISYYQDLARRSREKPFRVGRRSGRFGESVAEFGADEISQKDMFYRAGRQRSEADQTFLHRVKTGLTAPELETLIAKRPSVWGKYRDWVRLLPKRHGVGPARFKGGFGDGERTQD